MRIVIENIFCLSGGTLDFKMAESENIRIEKLQNPSQWAAWRFTVRVTLNANEIFDVVTGEYEKPEPAADGATEQVRAASAKEITAWKKKDARAQKVIVSTLGEKPLMHILNCTSAKAMWDKLHTVYEQKHEAGKHLLQQRFFAFEKDSADDMATHISKLEGIVQQLKDLDVNIDENMVITKIIMTLPRDYRYFISAWESTDQSKQTLDNLTSRLMIEESRVMMSSPIETSEALLAYKGGWKTKPKDQAKPRRPIKCFKCGGENHYKKDCKAGESNEQPRDDDGRSSKAFLTKMSQSSTTDVWYVDSGATDHVCKHRHWFSVYNELESKREITLANGSKTYGIGRGDIDVLSYTGTEWITKTLTNVLYVPESYANLFSSTCAMDNGHTSKSDMNTFQLLDGNDVVAMGARRGGLFQMMFEVLEPRQDESFANIAMKTETLQVWHERLGHQNIAHVKNILKQRNIKYIDHVFDCDGCAYGKQHKLPFGSRDEKSNTCGHMIHADVCGKIEKPSLGGALYFLVLKDDCSHMRFVYFMRKKSEVHKHFKSFVILAEKQWGYSVKILQSDNGTEFVNNEMKTFMEENGIRHRRTVPYTPEQNGAVEREMRTIMESARTMIHTRDLDGNLWAEAVNTAVYVLNRTGTSTIKDKSPYELWYGKLASIDNFHAFGTEVYVHIPKEKRRKLDAKSKKCLFVGYDENTKGFRLLDTGSNKVELARDVKFLSSEVTSVEVVTASDINMNETTGAEEIPVTQGKGSRENEDGGEQRSQGEIPVNRPAKITKKRPTMLDGIEEENVLDTRLRARGNSIDDSIISMAFLTIYSEPTSYEQAIASTDRRQWENAMNEELDSLLKNETWDLVPRPNDQKVIDNKWVYKIKTNPNGDIDRYKARLVGRGFNQQYGIDYEETFSPVVRFGSIRTMFALAAMNKMKIRQFDIKTAFLYGDLEETVYMHQPVGYDDNSGRVCQLRKSLYGLKQSSRCWNQKFSSFIKEFGFVVSKADPCVFVKNEKETTTILAIYVDDGMIIGNDATNIGLVIEHLEKQFEVKLVDVGCFLGVEVDQLEDGAIFIHQGAYARKIVQRFSMENCNAVSTPSDPNQRLTKCDDTEDEDFPYRQLIGSLMYLAIATRPDISFALGVVSRYMEHPKNIHVNAAKRILSYISGTLDHGIMYEGGGNHEFCGFSDSDYGGNLDTRKSTTGYTFRIGTGVVSWCSQSQKCVTLSTTEAEYIAASEATKELVWLKRLLDEIAPKQFEDPTLFMDNQSAIRLVKNPEYHKRTKHIDIAYHYIREKFNEGQLNLKYIPSHEQLADILTKPFPKERFEYLRNMMGITSIDKNK